MNDTNESDLIEVDENNQQKEKEKSKSETITLNDKVANINLSVIVTIINVIVICFTIFTLVKASTVIDNVSAVIDNASTVVDKASISMQTYDQIIANIESVSGTIKETTPDIETTSATIRDAFDNIIKAATRSRVVMEDIRTISIDSEINKELTSVVLKLEFAINNRNIEEIQMCFSRESDIYLVLESSRQITNATEDLINAILSIFKVSVPDRNYINGIATIAGVPFVSFRKISTFVYDNNTYAHFNCVQLGLNTMNGDEIFERSTVSVMVVEENNEWKLTDKLVRTDYTE